MADAAGTTNTPVPTAVPAEQPSAPSTSAQQQQLEAAKEHAFRMYGLAGQTAVVTGGTKVRVVFRTALCVVVTTELPPRCTPCYLYPTGPSM